MELSIEKNKVNIKCMLTLILFLCAVTLFSQEVPSLDIWAPATDTETEQPIDTEPSSRISDAESGALFLQRLSWQRAQYAVRYMVVLEKKNETTGVWIEVLRRNVSADFTYLDVSVPAGQYRYRISSFNILDQLDNQTSWEEFTVIQALQPSIVSFSPTAFYFDRLRPRIINLEGENLLPDTEIYLVSKNELDENGEPLVLKPMELHLNELGETARLIFDEEILILGRYDIIAKNPGGLETRAGDFTIALAKPYDLNVSGGYAPMLTLFGQKDYFLNRIFIPASVLLRVSFIPFKWSFGNLGAEFCPGWAFLSSENESYSTSANLVLAHFNVLFQYWLIQRALSVNGRLGLGVAGLFNYHFVFDTGKSGNSMSIAALTYNLGASVQWLLYKQIFVEVSLDFVHVTHSEIPMGFMRFGITGGYQF